MFRGKDVEEIGELKPEGLSIWAINRLNGYDRKTINSYLLVPTGRPVRNEACAGEQAGAFSARRKCVNLCIRRQTPPYNRQFG